MKKKKHGADHSAWVLKEIQTRERAGLSINAQSLRF